MVKTYDNSLVERLAEPETDRCFGECLVQFMNPVKELKAHVFLKNRNAKEFQNPIFFFSKGCMCVRSVSRRLIQTKLVGREIDVVDT